MSETIQAFWRGFKRGFLIPFRWLIKGEEQLPHLGENDYRI